MKILITSDWYAPTVNGVVTSVLNLRAQLLARGHDVRVLTLAGTTHTTETDGVIALGSVDVGRIYPGARLRSAAASDTVRRLIAWNPDIVHSQCEFSTFFLAKKIASACGAPLVHTYHTVYEDYTHYFSPSRRMGKRMAQFLSCLVLDRTDAVIAPTAKILRLLQGYGVRPSVFVIPTGIDLTRFSLPHPAAENAALRASLGIPAGNRVVLYLGRLAKEKNVEELLACRASLPENVTLLLVGDGPHRPALEAMARDLHLTDHAAVIFAGMVEPQLVPQYYALGDVFVSASGSETQGLTYVEALAAGLPAVCHADECLENVVLDGKNGWQYHTRADLAAHITTLLADETLRAAFSQKARQVAAGYSAARFADSVLDCYQKTLKKQPARNPENRKDVLWLSA